MKGRSALITGSVDGIGFAIAEALARSGGVTVKSINPGLTDTPLARTANPQWQDELALDVLGSRATRGRSPSGSCFSPAPAVAS